MLTVIVPVLTLIPFSPTVIVSPSAFTLTLPIASFNCFTLTASVSALPAATLVILLPPLFKPSLERTTLPAVTLPALPSIATGLSPPTVTTPFGPKDTLPAPSPSPAIDFIPFNSGFTLIPSLPTVIVSPSALTVILLSLPTSKPLPMFTLYFTVDVFPSALSTVAVVPTPFTKFTVSYGFTRSTAVPLPCKFQPAFSTSPTVAALFGLTSFLPVPIVGAA